MLFNDILFIVLFSLLSLHYSLLSLRYSLLLLSNYLVLYTLRLSWYITCDYFYNTGGFFNSNVPVSPLYSDIINILQVIYVM